MNHRDPTILPYNFGDDFRAVVEARGSRLSGRFPMSDSFNVACGALHFVLEGRTSQMARAGQRNRSHSQIIIHVQSNGLTLRNPLIFINDTF
eukprot:59769-Amphidinium_carterae.1